MNSPTLSLSPQGLAQVHNMSVPICYWGWAWVGVEVQAGRGSPKPECQRKDTPGISFRTCTHTFPPNNTSQSILRAHTQALICKLLMARQGLFPMSHLCKPHTGLSLPYIYIPRVPYVAKLCSGSWWGPGTMFCMSSQLRGSEA